MPLTLRMIYTSCGCGSSQNIKSSKAIFRNPYLSIDMDFSMYLQSPANCPVFQKVHIWKLHDMGNFRMQKFCPGSGFATK